MIEEYDTGSEWEPMDWSTHTEGMIAVYVLGYELEIILNAN